MDGILFDLDGTLLDTLEDLMDSVNYALQTEGFPQRSKQEIRAFVGNGVANLVHRTVPKGTPQPIEARCLETFRAHYANNMNKFDAAVKKLCAEQFEGYIDVAIGESETVKKKPAPDGPLLALRQLGCRRKDTLYVGDSEVDVDTAKNTGLACVGVTWGFRDRDVLEQKGAEYIIDRPEELLRLI